MALASDVIAEAAAMCGDRNQTLYTLEKVLPLLVRANRDLTLAFQLAGLGATEGIYETTGTVDPGDTTVPDYPADFAAPIELWEKLAGAPTEEYVPMIQQEWPADAVPGPALIYWEWKMDAISFLGATTSRDIRMTYTANLGTITDGSSAIVILNAEHYLAAKTASYAARFIGKNVTLGAELNREAQDALDLLLGVRVKEDQNVVLRMLPYSMNARRR